MTDSARDVIAGLSFRGKLFGAPIDFPMSTKKADDILTALRAAGFAVVPMEPTFEMMLAVTGPIMGASETYKAMLKAAQ